MRSSREHGVLRPIARGKYHGQRESISGKCYSAAKVGKREKETEKRENTSRSATQFSLSQIVLIFAGGGESYKQREPVNSHYATGQRNETKE